MIARLAVFRDWTWRVAAFSVLAALGALSAIAVSDGASGKPALTTTAPATQPTVTQPTVTQPTVTQPATTAAPPPVTTAPTTTASPPPTPVPTGLTRWPNRNGYTVVLQSLPASAQSSAEATARRAVAAGLRDVGVLDSSAYSSLHPGYLVVFSGIYAASAEAGAAADRAHAAGFARAYSRRISR
ncbi:MAG: hypothetical protein ACYDA3_01165 [Gaiellaceae bacterium]